MRSSTFTAQTALRADSANTGDVQTVTLPGGCSAYMVSCETANGRLSFDGVDPSGVGAACPIIYAGNPPQLILVRPGDRILKWVSTAAAHAILIVVPAS